MKKNIALLFAKQFRRLQITPKLLVIFSLVAALPLITVGYYTHKTTNKLEIDAGIERMLLHTNILALNISHSIQELHSELLFLSNVPPIQGIIRASNNNNFDSIDNSDLNMWVNRLDKILFSMLQSKKKYNSIIFSNEKGNLYTQILSINGNTVETEKNKLFRINAQHFFVETMKLNENEIYTGNIIANGNLNEIIGAMPIFDSFSKKKAGLLSINYNMNDIIAQLKNLENENSFFYIFEQNGNYIYKSKISQETLPLTEIFNNDNGYIIDNKNNTVLTYATIVLDNEENKYWKIVNKNNIQSLINRDLTNIIIIISVNFFLFIISLVIAHFFSRSIVKSIKGIRNALISLGKGQHPQLIDNQREDEFGEMINALNNVTKGMTETSIFAHEIGKGNLNTNFSPLSEDDILGNSLLNMRNSLKLLREEEEVRNISENKQNWSTRGIALFSDILRRNNDNITLLSEEIIRNLVDYLKANQGGIFVLNQDEDSSEEFLEMIACVAYNKKRSIQKNISTNDGLLGRVLEEKLSIYLTQLPHSYIQITSGLGEATPNCLLIVPLLVNDNIMGVIELASFNEMQPHERTFVEKIAESIAITLQSVKINEQTKKLLLQSKEQSEIMAAQEEEMRQNLEELQATQEESSRRESEISSMLQAIKENFLVIEFNVNKTIVDVNEPMLNILETSINNLQGKPHSTLLPIAQNKPEEFHKLWNNILVGKAVQRETNLIFNNINIWLLETYTPLLDFDGEVLKVISISSNITESKLQAQKLFEQQEIMAEQEEEMKINLEQVELFQKLLEEKDNAQVALIENLNKENVDKLEKLKLAQQNIERLANAVPGVICQMEANGDNQNKITFANAFTFNLFNINSNELFYDNQIKELILDEDKYSYENAINQGITYNTDFVWEGRILVNEKLKWIAIEAKCEKISQLKTLISCIISDITTTKMREEAYKLMTNESNFINSMLNSIPDLVFYKDTNYIYMGCNDAFAKKVGKRKDEIVGKSDFDIFPHDNALSFRNMDIKLLSSNTWVENTEKIVMPDNSTIYVHSIKSQIVDKEGNILGIFGITRDVTLVLLNV